MLTLQATTTFPNYRGRERFSKKWNHRLQPFLKVWSTLHPKIWPQCSLKYAMGGLHRITVILVNLINFAAHCASPTGLRPASRGLAADGTGDCELPNIISFDGK